MILLSYLLWKYLNLIYSILISKILTLNVNQIMQVITETKKQKNAAEVTVEDIFIQKI